MKKEAAPGTWIWAKEPAGLSSDAGKVRARLGWISVPSGPVVVKDMDDNVNWSAFFVEGWVNEFWSLLELVVGISICLDLVDCPGLRV